LVRDEKENKATKGGTTMTTTAIVTVRYLAEHSPERAQDAHEALEYALNKFRLCIETRPLVDEEGSLRVELAEARIED